MDGQAKLGSVVSQTANGCGGGYHGSFDVESNMAGLIPASRSGHFHGRGGEGGYNQFKLYIFSVEIDGNVNNSNDDSSHQIIPR